MSYEKLVKDIFSNGQTPLSERRFVNRLVALLSSRLPPSPNRIWSPQKKAELICLRYGLVGAREHTLAELAKRFSVSTQRIRQIEVGTIRELRQLFSIASP